MNPRYVPSTSVMLSMMVQSTQSDSRGSNVQVELEPQEPRLTPGLTFCAAHRTSSLAAPKGIVTELLSGSTRSDQPL